MDKCLEMQQLNYLYVQGKVKKYNRNEIQAKSELNSIESIISKLMPRSNIFGKSNQI